MPLYSTYISDIDALIFYSVIYCSPLRTTCACSQPAGVHSIPSSSLVLSSIPNVQDLKQREIAHQALALSCGLHKNANSTELWPELGFGISMATLRATTGLDLEQACVVATAVDLFLEAQWWAWRSSTVPRSGYFPWA